MKSITILISILAISVNGYSQFSRAYKKGNYYEVISKLEKKQDEINLNKSLKLAHSYYETKSYYKAKSLYYRVLNRKGLNDNHKLELANILLSTGMVDLSEKMIQTCQNRTSDKYEILQEKIKWIRITQSHPTKRRVTKMEYEKVVADNELTSYLNTVIEAVQMDRKRALKSNDYVRQSSDIMLKVNSSSDLSFVRNTFFITKNEVKYSLVYNDQQGAETTLNSKLSRKSRLLILETSLSINKESASKVLSFCNDGSNYVSPFLHGNKLYFSSDRPGGYGGFDLYCVEKLNTGEWGTPYNLGKKVNSKGNELYPSVFMNQIYFSSDGLPGYGGADLFASKITNEGISVAQNLGRRVNSGYDDLTIIRDNKDIYLVSNRDNLYGLDEVYRISDSDTQQRLAFLNR